MKCIICESDSIKTTLKGFFKGTEVYHCTYCKTLFYKRDTNLINRINEYYKQDYWNSRFTEPQTILSKLLWTVFPNADESRLKYIKKYIKRKCKFLEVGPGKGAFLKLLQKKHDSAIYAVEPDVNSSNAIKKDIPSVTIYNSEFEKIFLEERFHFIYLSHVLEHFLDINLIFEKMHELLYNDGFIFIEVPNNENKFMFKESFYNHPHTIEFSISSLEKLAKKHGFYVEKISTHANSVPLSDNLIKNKIALLSNLLKALKHNDIYHSTKKGKFIRMIIKKIN